MAYYLGRDVAVYIANESSTNEYTYVNTSTLKSTTAASGSDTVQFTANRDDPMFAGGKVADLTGVDVGLGATDEDVAYIGQRTTLKAEIKKETTISLTKKKGDAVWSTIWNGDGTNTMRWGHQGGAVTEDSATNVYTGLEKPTIHYGYRLHVQLKSGTEILCIQNCTINSYSVSVNPDGITEETMEFTSHVNPRIVATAYGTVTDATEL